MDGMRIEAWDAVHFEGWKAQRLTRIPTRNQSCMVLRSFGSVGPKGSMEELHASR